MQNSNIGRKPSFTRFKAFELLEFRKSCDATTSIDQFINLATREGVIDDDVSHATMQRLLSGAMFPDLKTYTADGEPTLDPYDYSQVPRRALGQLPKQKNLLEDGLLKPRLTKAQKRLLAAMREEIEAHISAQVQIAIQAYFAPVNARLAELEDINARRAGFPGITKINP